MSDNTTDANDGTARLGTCVQVPEDQVMELKELHDKLVRLKGKATSVATYVLWTRFYDLLPELRHGTWAIRHSMTKMYLVKLAHSDAD